MLFCSSLAHPQIENLENQGLVRELWLGRNRISVVQNLEHMKQLRCISLQVGSVCNALDDLVVLNA